MPTEYSLATKLTQMVEELIDDTSIVTGTDRDLSALRDHEVKVTPVLCLREDNNGDVKRAKGRPISVRKVSDLEKAIAPKVGDYLLVVDSGTFDDASDHQQRALLFDALLLIDVTEVNGNIKMGKRQPDLICNVETLRVFGPCSNTDLAVLSALKAGMKAHPQAVKMLEAAAVTKTAAEGEEGEEVEEVEEGEEGEEVEEKSKKKRKLVAAQSDEPEDEVDPDENEPADDETVTPDDVEPDEDEAGKPVSRRKR